MKKKVIFEAFDNTFLKQEINSLCLYDRTQNISVSNSKYQSTVIDLILMLWCTPNKDLENLTESFPKLIIQKLQNTKKGFFKSL